MKTRISKRIKGVVYWFEEAITSHILVTSLILGLPCVCLIFMYPINRLDVLPHIITYASCNLALIGFIFSILLGIRGGEIHARLKKYYPKILKKYYYHVFRITLASIATILLSVLILAIPCWNDYTRYIMGFLGFVAFFYMLIGTTWHLLFMIRLMIKDEEQH